MCWILCVEKRGNTEQRCLCAYFTGHKAYWMKARKFLTKPSHTRNLCLKICRFAINRHITSFDEFLLEMRPRRRVMKLIELLDVHVHNIASKWVFRKEKKISGVGLMPKEVVSPQVVANWFANKRKELRRRSNDECTETNAVNQCSQLVNSYCVYSQYLHTQIRQGEI